MQQIISRLTVYHLIDANKMLNELRKLCPLITFRQPIGGIPGSEVLSFSDASLSISLDEIYGLTGIILGLRYKAKDDATIYHIIDWSCAKWKRVLYTSYDAEIIVCTEADDTCFYLKSKLNSISPTDRCTHFLYVDSKGVFDITTTLHEGK